ncbi:glycosyltransferase family 2 protein [Hyphomicrobium facile]|uniref:Glycosyltransferase involved in cell wall bisynthesis n=1 Tax=Hyphomicrobium facile TaxID=51670 RepID=A0A1I7NFS2_9HYPH|nr:glycosyltransferase family 2 protein [Hyphomicrobium facile]SFV33490.1 Glycosyltransferase involved in cell wall bisynthesis [Hyphomicrobium facile]
MRGLISRLARQLRGRRNSCVTVCLIIKDEGRYLPEWIAHYLALGFDRIVIYDNNSRPETLAIERVCAQQDARITVIPWPDVPSQFAQIAAYEDALRRCATDWIAFFDTDEFLVLKKHASIQSYLKCAPVDAGAVCINWVIFGSSGEARYRPELVARRFRRCSLTADINRHVKCIVRRAGAKRMSHPHSPKLRKRYTYVDSDLKPITLDQRAFNANYTYETAQLNHYVLRSREEYQWKLERGTPEPREGGFKNRKFADPESFWAKHDFNDTLDRSIDVWVDRASELRSTFSKVLGEQDHVTEGRAVPIST